MLLPQTKEREYRFKLALRMGLPIFALIMAFVSHTLIDNYATLNPSFYFESIILLVFGIYFILYLIYSGFDVKITDSVSKTFTREYLYKYLKKELKTKGDYTFILISIENLNDINRQYGIKNGDRVLESTASWIGRYLLSQKIENFPLGHIKGGDFILSIKGLKGEFETVLELMCLKSAELKVDNIEIKISGALVDSTYSRELDYIVENLFELQEERKSSRRMTEKIEINPNDLEVTVTNAIKNRSIQVMTQNVYADKEVILKECSVKLLTPERKPLFAKAFMKVVNKLGLGVEYDLMIIEELILNAKEQGIPYALNISPTSLRNESFLHLVKELLKNSPISFIFVLSESEYYSHTSRYNSILNSLRRVGVLIAIDRLGSIHTSFLYLRELEFDIIRFDTYYSSYEKLELNSAVIDGFNLMAHEKGIISWIKNIGDNESKQIAFRLNIDYIQGKELSKMEPLF